MENKTQECKIGSGLSIWETMSNEALIKRLEEMKAELEYLNDAIGSAETELYYRKNPELRRR